MDTSYPANNDQATLWNGSSGSAWVELRESLDRIFKPFEDLLVEAVSALPVARVLDVGCGAGSTTLAVARLLGAKGCAIGIDISEPLIAAARERAEREGMPTSFICADVQAHAFEPASFDMIISRFGVMFFDDPVRGFANLRRTAADNAELRFVAWRSTDENPFMTTAERVAAPLLPNLPARQPDASGQFAFADRDRVQMILEESGWAEVEIRPIDATCRLPEQKLIPYLMWLGPLGRALQESNGQRRAQVLAAVRPAFDPYVHGEEVRFVAACWMVSARNAGGSR